MNVRFFTHTLISTIFIVSCNKKDFVVEAQSLAASVVPKTYFASSNSSSNYYVSGWETVSDWNTTDSSGFRVLSYNRTTPELSQPDNGAVLVFAKGYAFDLQTTMDQKPLSLPFYFMSADDRYMQPYHWFSNNTEGNIKVALMMPKEMEDGFKKGGQKMQFRYFVLNDAFLKKHDLELKALRSITYNQLVQLLAITP
jgi:hypothetical protein